MTDFTVDPDGNVKDCREDCSSSFFTDPSPLRPDVHPLFGPQADLYGTPTPLLKRIWGFLGLFALVFALWFIGAGICWMITGRWPEAKIRGRPPFPLPGWSTIERPRIPRVVPSIPELPAPSPEGGSPWPQSPPKLP